MDVNNLYDLFDTLRNSYHNWRWIPIEEKLPLFGTEVLVYGLIKKINICKQGYIARRFTGFSSGWEGISEGREPPWQWLNTQDRVVVNVTHWMPLPENERYGIDDKYVMPNQYNIDFLRYIKDCEGRT